MGRRLRSSNVSGSDILNDLYTLRQQITDVKVRLAVDPNEFNRFLQREAFLAGYLKFIDVVLNPEAFTQLDEEEELP